MKEREGDVELRFDVEEERGMDAGVEAEVVISFVQELASAEATAVAVAPPFTCVSEFPLLGSVMRISLLL
jgi:hypothetical protein